MESGVPLLTRSPLFVHAALHDADPAFRSFSRSQKVAQLISSLGFKRPLPVQSMYIFKVTIFPKTEKHVTEFNLYSLIDCFDCPELTQRCGAVKATDMAVCSNRRLEGRCGHTRIPPSCTRTRHLWWGCGGRWRMPRAQTAACGPTRAHTPAESLGASSKRVNRDKTGMLLYSSREHSCCTALTVCDLLR